MEIIIGIIIVIGIAALLMRASKKNEETVVAESAPYKVETVEAKVEAPVENTVAVAVALDLEGAEATIAKKPRKPRTPKAVAEKKPAAKKAPARKPKAK